MPIPPPATSPSSPAVPPLSEEGHRDNSSSTDSERQARTSTRFQGGPPQLQGRPPRTRPTSSNAGAANSHQANSATDADYSVEQHVRTGTQLLNSAGTHHQAGQVGSGQIGVAAKGDHNASAANRIHSAGAIEEAAVAQQSGAASRLTRARPVFAQRPLMRLQQAAYDSANTRLKNFSQFGISERVVDALQSQLIHVDMRHFKSMHNGMTPDIGIMHECIKLAQENNAIDPDAALQARCAMGMAEASNVISNRTRLSEGVAGHLAPLQAEILNVIIGRRHGELSRDSKDSSVTVANKALNKLESEFGQTTAANHGNEPRYGQQGQRIVEWASKQLVALLENHELADKAMKNVMSQLDDRAIASGETKLSEGVHMSAGKGLVMLKSMIDDQGAEFRNAPNIDPHKLENAVVS
jgi:hypothetical protein